MTKEQFVIKWVKKIEHVDTLNAFFVDDYILIFKPKKINFKLWGTDHVPELARLLKKMYDEDTLDRDVVNINPSLPGFPHWTYAYFLKKDK